MEPKISAAEKEPILNRLMEMLYPGALDAYSKRQLKQHDNFRAETAQYQQALRDGPMMDAPLPGANPEVPDLRTGMTGVLTGALGVPGAASKPFENVLRMEQSKAPPQSRTKASRIENIKFHAEDARTRATEAELAGDAPQAAYWKDMYQRRLIDVNKVVNAKPEPKSNLSAMLKIAQKNMRENPVEPAKNQAQVDAAHEKSLIASAPHSLEFKQPSYRRSGEEMGKAMGQNQSPGTRKGFNEQNYKFELPVAVRWADGSVHTDVVKGLNKGHALQIARSNWPNADFIEAIKMSQVEKLDR